MADVGAVGRRRRPWRRSFVVVTGAVALSIGYVVTQNEVLRGATIAGYRVVDPRTIEVTVGVAQRSWTRLTNVAETASDVQVTVESLPYPQLGAGTGELDLVPVRVSLRADLAGRTVTDPAGEPIPAQ